MVRYKVIYWPYELHADECPNLHTATLRGRYSQCVLWGGTCAEIRSEALRIRLLAPANSSHLRSLRSVAVYGGADNSPAHPALAHAAAPMSSTPINKVSKRVRGYKELPSSRGSMPRADVVENQLSSAIHSRLPTSNTSRARPKVLYSTVNENSSCPTAQVVGRNLLLLQQNRTEKSRRCGNGYILVWKPANKAFAGLCWCQIPMAGISWPQ